MPIMNGLELLTLLKENYPEIPVSIASAYGDQQTQEKAKSLGAKDFFEKPINFNQLKIEINKLI